MKGCNPFGVGIRVTVRSSVVVASISCEIKSSTQHWIDDLIFHHEIKGLDILESQAQSGDLQYDKMVFLKKYPSSFWRYLLVGQKYIGAKLEFERSSCCCNGGAMEVQWRCNIVLSEAFCTSNH
jgi:hypothetical protein